MDAVQSVPDDWGLSDELWEVLQIGLPKHKNKHRGKNKFFQSRHKLYYFCWQHPWQIHCAIDPRAFYAVLLCLVLAVFMQSPRAGVGQDASLSEKL